VAQIYNSAALVGESLARLQSLISDLRTGAYPRENLALVPSIRVRSSWHEETKHN
jgi:hypothetical protein